MEFEGLKHTLRYLVGTKDLAMVHKTDGETRFLNGSSDTDWAGCAKTRKTTCCGVVRWCGVILLSFARTESVLAQSSPEAEYLGVVMLASEMLFLHELLKSLGFDTHMRIHADASSAIAIASRRGLGKVLHLEVK